MISTRQEDSCIYIFDKLRFYYAELKFEYYVNFGVWMVEEEEVQLST